MVLYDFLVMVKSSVPRNQLADILRRTGTRVLDAGGVITDITSYGTRTLAYEFTSPGEKHFEVRTAQPSRGFPSRKPRAPLHLPRFPSTNLRPAAPRVRRRRTCSR